MRKFIISDIHGSGNVYYSIMGYLDNISKNEDICLFINGDLIDRGIESGEILFDIKERIRENKYKIIYLGGNHELLMYQTYLDRENGINTYFNDWYDNGGSVTDDYILEKCNYETDKILDVVNFISNLDIYYKFNEKINDKNIVLVHAGCPIDVKDNCDLKIKTNNDDVFWYVWARENDPFIPFRCRIGNKDYYTIVGHTPNNSKYGFFYSKRDEYLNIDGGCAYYVSGYFKYNHTPLVEVNDGYFKILTFNNNNEVIYGNYFDGKRLFHISNNELDRDREYLNKEVKIKKLVKLPDNIIGYKDWIK